MTERELRERLGALALPDEAQAQERAWATVRRAYLPTAADRARRRHAQRRWRVIVPALATLALLLAVTLAAGSAPRHALAGWFRAALGLSAPPAARPTLGALPSGGQLLTETHNGLWIVGPQGKRRYLGRYSGGALSPHSRYVIAWRGNELAALDLRGRPQWTAANAGAVSVARWSPDGYRIAYLVSQTLTIIAGDASGQHALPGPVRAVAPAWQPGVGALHRLAVVDAHGDVQLRAADTGAILWTARPSNPARQLLWTADGDRLIVISDHQISLYNARGERTASRKLDGHIAAAATDANTELAVILEHPRLQTASLVLVNLDRSGALHATRSIFTAAQTLTAPAFSPNHRWLILASPSADQWLFLRIAGAMRIAAVSDIQAKFYSPTGPPSSFPQPAGWRPVNRTAPGS